jgi:flagellar biosynthesis/type III secretory pathway protein FliH
MEHTLECLLDIQVEVKASREKMKGYKEGLNAGSEEMRASTNSNNVIILKN